MNQDTLPLNDCKDCANNGGVFSLKCPQCRTRIAVNEPCKLARKVMVDGMRKWGSTENWEVEPNCGCFKICRRLDNQRNAKRDS